MSNATRQSPPRPVLFTKENGGSEVLHYKLTKESPCRAFSLDKSHKMGICLQKCDGANVIKQSLHNAKVASIFDLGPSGFSITLEVENNWKLNSTIFMNRKNLEELRDKLNAFLGNI